jgi:hypothetical protein
MGEPRRLHFRCDDAAGFEFQVLQASDGDFHLSIVPHPADFNREHEGEDRLFLGCYGASTRVRVPTIGGGSHDALWHALAGLFRGTSTTKSTTPAISGERREEGSHA